MKTQPPEPDLFSRKRYEERRGEIRLHMSYFFLKYLTDIYEAFEGDLAMTIILGEISHHNTARFFSPEGAPNEAMRSIQNDVAYWTAMDGCNAYSMSCATGIPRETVRRKIAELKKKGWVEDVPGQGLRITKACGDHFGADYSLRFLNGLLRASRNIEALLAEDSGHGPKKKKTIAASATRRSLVKPSAPKPKPKPKPKSKTKRNP